LQTVVKQGRRVGFFQLSTSFGLFLFRHGDRFPEIVLPVLRRGPGDQLAARLATSRLRAQPSTHSWFLALDLDSSSIAARLLSSIARFRSSSSSLVLAGLYPELLLFRSALRSGSPRSSSPLKPLSAMLPNILSLIAPRLFRSILNRSSSCSKLVMSLAF
jgi:hypothetical protein